MLELSGRWGQFYKPLCDLLLQSAYSWCTSPTKTNVFPVFLLVHVINLLFLCYPNQLLDILVVVTWWCNLWLLVYIKSIYHLMREHPAVSFGEVIMFVNREFMCKSSSRSSQLLYILFRQKVHNDFWGYL